MNIAATMGLICCMNSRARLIGCYYLDNLLSEYFYSLLQFAFVNCMLKFKKLGGRVCEVLSESLLIPVVGWKIKGSEETIKEMD